jgi:hypothetical protein
MAPTRTSRAPELVGAKAGSKAYGFKYTSFRGLIHRGEIAGIRIGRALYVDRRDIEDWIESRKERGETCR